MIIFSNAFVLTPALVLSANNPIVGWQNLVTAGGISAEHEDADYPAVNLANPATSIKQAWRSDSTAEQTVTFTVSSEDPVDYVGIARHNFGSGEVEVEVEYPDPDNEGEWLSLAGPTMPGDDAPLVFRFPEVFTDTVRLKLTPGSVAPQMAVVYIGQALILQRRIYVPHTPLHMGREASVESGMSESGEFLGRVLRSESLSTAVSIQNLEPDWVRTYMLPFLAAAKLKPFFFAWRPQDYPLECGFAWLINSPRPQNQRPNGMMQMDLQIGGLAL